MEVVMLWLWCCDCGGGSYSGVIVVIMDVVVVG